MINNHIRSKTSQEKARLTFQNDALDPLARPLWGDRSCGAETGGNGIIPHAWFPEITDPSFKYHVLIKRKNICNSKYRTSTSWNYFRATMCGIAVMPRYIHSWLGSDITMCTLPYPGTVAIERTIPKWTLMTWTELCCSTNLNRAKLIMWLPYNVIDISLVCQNRMSQSQMLRKRGVRRSKKLFNSSAPEAGALYKNLVGRSSQDTGMRVINKLYYIQL